MVSDQYIRKLHEKIFDATWKEAGQYRVTEKNISVPVHEIRDRSPLVVAVAYDAHAASRHGQSGDGQTALSKADRLRAGELEKRLDVATAAALACVCSSRSCIE